MKPLASISNLHPIPLNRIRNNLMIPPCFSLQNLFPLHHRVGFILFSKTILRFNKVPVNFTTKQSDMCARVD